MREQLRRICRISGVRVSIDTINTRDSLYRTSVDYVLNACSRLVLLGQFHNFYLCWFSPVIYINKHCRALSNSTTVEIDGEDAREFIAGLADNIGLENIRAARMVSAAVAARTRSCFLQAWVISHTLSLAFVSFFFFLGSFVLSLSFSLWGDWLGAVNARSPSSGLDSVHV